jgi:hypothetical protein
MGVIELTRLGRLVEQVRSTGLVPVIGLLLL